MSIRPESIIRAMSVLALVIVVVAAYYAGNAGAKCPAAGNQPSQTCTGPAQEAAACDLSDLKAEAQFEGAAGNIYGRFSITNTTTKACTVQGKNFVQVNYDTGIVKNIDVTLSGLASVQTYALAPSASIYALIHMPNGPQCGSAVNQVTAGYTYDIGSGKSVAFTDSVGKSQFIIQACVAAQDRTQIKITNMSDQLPENGQGL